MTTSLLLLWCCSSAGGKGNCCLASSAVLHPPDGVCMPVLLPSCQSYLPTGKAGESEREKGKERDPSRDQSRAAIDGFGGTIRLLFTTSPATTTREEGVDTHTDTQAHAHAPTSHCHASTSSVAPRECVCVCVTWSLGSESVCRSLTHSVSQSSQNSDRVSMQTCACTHDCASRVRSSPVGASPAHVNLTFHLWMRERERERKPRFVCSFSLSP